jgi:hypothetical protein
MLYEQKIKINNMINKIKDKMVLKEIFNVVHTDLNIEGEHKYTYNSNGIYFDLNILSESALQAIEDIVFNLNLVETESESIKYNVYSQEDTIKNTN